MMIMESYINKEKKAKPILFYKAVGKYGFLSSLFKKKLFYTEKIEDEETGKITYEIIEFNSAEHAYQYGKFKDKEDAKIAMQLKPHLCAILAHGLMVYDMDPKWPLIKVSRMQDVIKTKFQDRELRAKLLETGNAELIEKSKTDNFWGCGKKGNGKNMLGKLLMKRRERLNEL